MSFNFLINVGLAEAFWVRVVCAILLWVRFVLQWGGARVDLRALLLCATGDVLGGLLFVG